MNQVELRIPEGMTFNDLRVRRAPDGGLIADQGALYDIAVASGFTGGRMPGPVAKALIMAWYGRHIALGGEVNEACEELLADALSEVGLERSRFQISSGTIQ